ncbi:MAG: hypothetical protein JO041_12105 [Acidobacteria bacterium]|nr:hypothetical protein [Acidobacteriota bacterium]
MRKRRFIFAIVLLFMATGLPAQEGPLRKEDPKGVAADHVIQQFAAREKDFRSAWEKYIYREDIKVQTLDGDTPDGEFRLVYDVTFNDQGKRAQQVVFAPSSTLQRIGLSSEDYEQFENVVPFSLTSDELPKYQILYVGQQKEDELDTYVFDVAPKQILKGQHYFQGRIWVDQKDLQIVLTRGKIVPETRDPKGKKQENLFPDYTTYREQVDGQYWFPTYARADDTLHFAPKYGGDVHIRSTIKFTNYRRFGSDVKIQYGGKEIEKAPNGQKPDQKPPR